jgi:membrane dipeptidase
VPADAAKPLSNSAPFADWIIINSCGGFELPVDFRPASPGDLARGPGIDRNRITDALASGMTAANQTIGYVLGTDEPFEQSMRDIGIWESVFRNEPRLLKVRTASDIERARRQHALGIILGFQNAAMLGTQLDRVDTFAALGIRIIQLTYNNRNSLGGGALTPGNPGLTEFGHQVVDRLNARRVIVDLSHSGAQLCLDAARASARPVAITHTGCRALTGHPRNTTDEALRLVATKGGYVGIYFIPFLATGRTATADDLISHLEHAIQVCGEDHVGIGTDGGTSPIDLEKARAANIKQHAERVAAGVAAPGESADVLNFIPALTGPDQFRKLADLLASRGHRAARIEKILGRNFLDFAREIWGG